MNKLKREDFLQLVIALRRSASPILTCFQLVLVSVHEFFKRAIVTSAVQFFLFPKLRMSRKFRVADSVAFSRIHVRNVTADR